MQPPKLRIKTKKQTEFARNSLRRILQPLNLEGRLFTTPDYKNTGPVMLFTGWCSTTPTLLRTFVCHLVGKMVIQKAHECSSCYAWLSVFIDVIKLVLPGIVSSSYPPLAIWKGSHNSSFWVVAIVGFFLQLDHQVEPLLTTRLSTWGKFQGFDPLPEAPVTGAAFA